jgi:[amino group carrier protein]-lysine/ornithine hydrolase
VDELALLERLVRRYSPSGRERPAVQEFIRIARELGYAARIDAAGNGVAQRGRGRPTVLFLGHIDTVDDDLPVRRRPGLLYGRGAVDAKGPLVAALIAGHASVGPGTIRVVAAVGEETDSRGARHIVRGRRPDAVIAGEPSGWDGLTIGYKGELQLRVLFPGARAHYSSPEPTAADRAVDWLVAARNLALTRRKESNFRSPTLKIIGLETRRSAHAESADVTVDFRLPPSISTHEMIQMLKKLQSESPELDARIRIEAVEVDRTNVVAESLIAGIRAAGGRPTIWRKAGTSDLSLAVAAWGIPGAAYGPGDAHLDHTDREFVSAADLRRSVAVLTVAFDRLRRS